MRAAATDEWFGQPRGLTVLFLTEMWEKFSYYGMRSLLVYYMTKQLLLGQAHASLVYGLYTGFVYLTPLFGGAISDRWLDRRTAVILGGAIMAIGHFMMSQEWLLYPALAVIAIGNGFFLPNLPSQIGSLYAGDDPRRSGAFNIYYAGINLGAVLAPLGCGTVGEIYGWHWGFGLAGAGMVLGLAIYVAGARWLPPQPPRSAPHRTVAPDGARFSLVLFGVFLAVVILRGAYEQMGNTLALWTDTAVDRHLGAFEIPRTWFLALNPLLVFVFTPILVARWSKLAAAGREASAMVKMSMGAAGIAAAYLMLSLVARLAGDAAVSWLWLAAFVALLTLAELHVLPIGLSLFARLAPAGRAATAIAAWFCTSFVGNLFAGGLGAQWSRMPPEGFFFLLAGVASLAAVILFGLDGAVRRAERPVDVKSPPASALSHGAPQHEA